MKINFGCGTNKLKGWLNVDISAQVKPDKVVDLNKFPLPFKNNVYDEILCKHVVEHLEDPIKFIEECHRILKPKGKLRIICPYFSHHTAYRPVHKTFWSYESLDFLQRAHNKNYYSSMNFELKKKIILTKKRWLNFLNKFINLKPLYYEILFCWLLPAREVHYNLTKK